MSTQPIVTTNARNERQQESEKIKYAQKYVAYLKLSKQEASTEGIMVWDEKHNDSRIKALFGSKESIYRAGLWAKYDSFIYAYVRLPRPGNVTAQSASGPTKKLQERVVVGETGKTDAYNASATVKELWKLKAYREIKTQMRILNGRCGMTWPQIAKWMQTAVAEAERGE